MWSAWITRGVPSVGDYIRVRLDGSDDVPEGHVVRIREDRYVEIAGHPDDEEEYAVAWQRWEGPEDGTLVKGTRELETA